MSLPHEKRNANDAATQQRLLISGLILPYFSYELNKPSRPSDLCTHVLPRRGCDIRYATGAHQKNMSDGG